MERMRVLIMAVAVLCVGCGGERSAMEEMPMAPAQESAAAVVDSIIPIPVALERFRADIDRLPTDLIGGTGSIEALTRRVVELLAASDTSGFEAIALDRAEFAYLYY